MKVDYDLQLTLMASSLYRILGQRIGNGYEAGVYFATWSMPPLK